MSEHVRIERDGDVLAITLNRPERRNAITVAMYAALADAIEAAAGDASLRLITLKGEGQDFTAGNDLGDFLAEMPRDGSDIPVWRLLRALARESGSNCRRGAWQCRRHRHDHAVPLRPGDCRDRARASSCRSWISGSYRRRRVRCFCHGSRDAAVPRNTSCSGTRSGPAKRWSSVSSAISRRTRASSGNHGRSGRLAAGKAGRSPALNAKLASSRAGRGDP